VRGIAHVVELLEALNSHATGLASDLIARTKEAEALANELSDAAGLHHYSVEVKQVAPEGKE
jgi:hypothetical protein